MILNDTIMPSIEEIGVKTFQHAVKSAQDKAIERHCENRSIQGVP
jgi:hypothetical protein